MLERLQKVPNATLLCSNPCFELWLLLHYADQKTELSSEECVSRLLSFEKQYKKGALLSANKQYLMCNVTLAITRARNLRAFNNPSTTIHLLIEALESLKTKER